MSTTIERPVASPPETVPHPVNWALGLLLGALPLWCALFVVADVLSQDGQRTAGQPWDTLIGIGLVAVAAIPPVVLLALSLGTLARTWRRAVAWLWLLPVPPAVLALWFLAMLGTSDVTSTVLAEFALLAVVSLGLAVALARWPRRAWRWTGRAVAAITAATLLITVVYAVLVR